MKLANEVRVFVEFDHFFYSKGPISRFGERFRDGQYSLVSFLFAVLLLTVPPRAKPFLKVGARAPVPHGVDATECSSAPMTRNSPSGYTLCQPHPLTHCGTMWKLSRFGVPCIKSTLLLTSAKTPTLTYTVA